MFCIGINSVHGNHDGIFSPGDYLAPPRIELFYETSTLSSQTPETTDSTTSAYTSSETTEGSLPFEKTTWIFVESTTPTMEPTTPFTTDTTRSVSAKVLDQTYFTK